MTHKQKKIFVIAEAGVNHNGNVKLAFKLIDIAAEAKADAVKFQTFKTENLVSVSAPKAEYQLKTTGKSGTQFNMLKKLELSFEHLHALKKYAEKKGLEFMSTAFDFESLRFLVEEIGIKRIKIPSGEITNGPMLFEAAKTKLPIILSTGASDQKDIHDALEVIAYGYLHPKAKSVDSKKLKSAFKSTKAQKILKEKVTILHCVSEYPAPVDGVNIKSIPFIREKFKLPVGFSDHTLGIEVAIASVALGISVLEKHFTIDKTLSGPDHAASLNPQGLKSLIESIRNVEAALGFNQKAPTDAELKNQKIIRKSIVAARPIKAGEVFTSHNVALKRPALGLSPMKFWSVLGRKSKRNYKKDESIRG